MNIYTYMYTYIYIWRDRKLFSYAWNDDHSCAKIYTRRNIEWGQCYYYLICIYIYINIYIYCLYCMGVVQEILRFGSSQRSALWSWYHRPFHRDHRPCSETSDCVPRRYGWSELNRWQNVINRASNELTVCMQWLCTLCLITLPVNSWVQN